MAALQLSNKTSIHMYGIDILVTSLWSGQAFHGRLGAHTFHLLWLWISSTICSCSHVVLYSLYLTFIACLDSFKCLQKEVAEGKTDVTDLLMENVRQNAGSKSISLPKTGNTKDIEISDEVQYLLYITSWKKKCFQSGSSASPFVISIHAFNFIVLGCVFMNDDSCLFLICWWTLRCVAGWYCDPQSWRRGRQLTSF